MIGQLILNTFAIPAVTVDVYKGKIFSAIKDKSPIGRKSRLGTLIFSDLQFAPVNFPDGLTNHIPIDTALFSVNQAKNIVVTNIQGRDGSIKEYMGLSDYNINIKGTICGENGVYPQDAVDNLIKFLEYNQSLGITSSYLNNVFNIQEIVVVKYDLPQMEGGQSYQKFELDCLSDKPVEILISEAV